MTLGATPQNVRRMVVKHGMILALIGIVLGVTSGLALTRVISSSLFGVKPWDPSTFAATAIVLAVVAPFACYIPAHRASRLDPMTVLRQQ